MLEDVKKRLEIFGYDEVTEIDNQALAFFILKSENYIKNECGLATLPEELNQITVDMVVGEFLLHKKNSGQLTYDDIKSIQEGDTTITFKSTPEERLDDLIKRLLKPDLSSYRAIKW